MRKLNHVTTFLFTFYFATLLAQNVGINETGSSPNPSAMLDIASTNKGILIPRLTSIQRDSIFEPAEGLLVYQLDEPIGFYYFSDKKWKYVGESSYDVNAKAFEDPSKPWTLAQNYIYAIDTTLPGADWTINGIGTLYDYPLRFIVDSLERARFTQQGRLGIGTVSPTSFIHIRQNVPIPCFGCPPPIITPTMRFELNYGFSLYNRYFDIKHQPTKLLMEGFSKTNLFVINANGSIGVNTAAVSAGMNINSILGTSALALNITHVNKPRFSISNNGNVKINVDNYNTDTLFTIRKNNKLNFSIDKDGRVDLYHNKPETQIVFSIKNTTITGAGTYPTVFRVFSNGEAHSKSMKVVISPGFWADYVFDEDYKLLSLTEVENYIKENKHLPNVPSADEVETNGNNLGEMDAILLRKIEELTLYIIELEKKVNQLSK